MDEVLKSLDQLHIKPNKRRLNVSDQSCQTINMGLVHQRFKKGVRFSKLSTDNEPLYNQLVDFCRSNNPGFNFTTITLNHNLQCKAHVDQMNKGLSRIIGLGDYTGGELRIYNEDGSYVDHDIHNKWLEFDGKKLHQTLPFQGNRWTLVYFTHRAVH